MTAKTTDPADYNTLSTELETVLSALQQPDVQVHDAVALYERGLKVIAQLENFVSDAEHKLESVRVQAAPQLDSE